MPSMRTTLVGRLYRWWVQELADALTPRRASTRAWRTLLRQTPEGLEIATRSGASVQQLGTLPEAATSVDVAQMRALLSRSGTRGSGPILLRLSEGHVVERTIQIPSAASDVIEPVLRNQLERIVPWPLDNTRYGYRIVETDDIAAGQIGIHIVATTRTLLDAALQRAESIGVAPDAVEFAPDGSADGAGIELLSLSPDPVAKTANALQATLALLLVCALTIGAFGFYQMWNRQVESEEMAARISVARSRVAEVQRLNEENAQLRQQRERLVRRKRKEPAVLLLIEALSRTLPDSAYLIELEIYGRDTRIVGKSDDPTGLITMLENTPQFEDVHFVAPTTREQGETAGTFSIIGRAQGAPSLEKRR